MQSRIDLGRLEVQQPAFETVAEVRGGRLDLHGGPPQAPASVR